MNEVITFDDYVNEIRLARLDDDDQFVACVSHLDHFDRVSSTLRLWIVARALESRNYERVIDLLTNRCEYSASSAKLIVSLAAKLGSSLIGDAVSQRAWRSLRQWIALGQALSSPNKEQAVRAMIEDDVPPIEVEAIALGISLEEAAKRRVSLALVATALKALRMGMSADEVVDTVKEAVYAR